MSSNLRLQHREDEPHLRRVPLRLLGRLGPRLLLLLEAIGPIRGVLPTRRFLPALTKRSRPDRGRAVHRPRRSGGVRTSIPLQRPLSLNDKGQVAGFAGGFFPRGAVYSVPDGTLTPLSLGGNQSAATAINASGRVAGSGTLPGSQIHHAFAWDGSTIQDLGTLGGDGNSSAGAINGRGHIAGSASISSTQAHAFVFDGETMHDLGTLQGCDRSNAAAINDAGTAVGSVACAQMARRTPSSSARRGALSTSTPSRQLRTDSRTRMRSASTTQAPSWASRWDRTVSPPGRSCSCASELRGLTTFGQAARARRRCWRSWSPTRPHLHGCPVSGTPDARHRRAC